MGNDSDLIWHYTTSAGLNGLLVDHKLRATSTSFVNDPSEQRFGQTAVLEALSRLSQHQDERIASAAREMKSYRQNGLITLSDQFGFSDRMVACASSAEDSLDMWRAYGSQTISGTFAVGLDPRGPLGPLFEDEEVRGNWFSHWGADAAMKDMRDGWTTIIYATPDDLAQHAHQELERGTNELDLDGSPQDIQFAVWQLVDHVVADIEARYKHHSYRAENELRLQATLTSKRQFKVFPRAHGITAYLELSTAQEWGRPVATPSRLPIREVILWPGAPRQAFDGVAAALVHGGHNYSQAPYFADSTESNVQTRESQVPFV